MILDVHYEVKRLIENELKIILASTPCNYNWCTSVTLNRQSTVYTGIYLPVGYNAKKRFHDINISSVS